MNNVDWKNYSNNKEYGSYNSTEMPTTYSITKEFSQLNAAAFIRQFDESIRIIGTTTKPLIFFYRYDFAIKRAIALIYMSKYVHINGSPEYAVNNLLQNKDEYTRQMIDRCINELRTKISTLKSHSTKTSYIQRFVDGFEQYYDEISERTQLYLENGINNLQIAVDKGQI